MNNYIKKRHNIQEYIKYPAAIAIENRWIDRQIGVLGSRKACKSLFLHPAAIKNLLYVQKYLYLDAAKLKEIYLCSLKNQKKNNKDEIKKVVVQ